LQHTLTPGNKLYFYRLLSERFGFGRQTFVTHVEEALADEGLSAEDLGIASTRELLEMLDEFVTILDFKGGRSYIRIERLPDWDKYLEAAEDDKGRKGAAASGKPWRKGRQPKGARPTRPKCVRRPAEKDAGPAASSDVAGSPSLEAPSPSLEAPSGEAAGTPSPEHSPESAEDEAAGPDDTSFSAPASAPVATPAPELAPAGADADAGPGPEVAGEPEAASGLGSEPEAVAAEAVAVEAVAGVRDTVKPDPEADAGGTVAEPAAAATTSAAAPEARPAAEPAAVTVAAAGEVPDLRGIPTDFCAEVHLPTRLAGALARVLPFDVNLPRVLDEDWAYAVSTGAVRGSRTRVSFPLRYLHSDGTPIELALAHGKPDPAGRSWRVERVDGDATGEAQQAAGLAGSSTVPEPWELLVPARRDFDERLSVTREFASLVAIPSWDALLGALASACAPEGWAHDQSGDAPDDRGLLRYYLCATVHRIMCQGGLVQDADGGRAVLDTGLRDPRGLDVYLTLRATEKDASSGVSSPWTADAVVAADPLAEERTGALAGFAELPLPASYLAGAEGLVPALDARVELDLRQVALHQLARLPHAFLEGVLATGGSSATGEGSMTGENQALGEGSATAEDPAADEDQATVVRAAELLADGSFDELGRLILGDDVLLARLGRPIELACQRALRSAALGFRPCAPAYDPSADVVAPLLPLALAGDAVDCSAALRPTGDGGYVVGAFLSVADARACARPACACLPAWLL
jgi:hypothetical protein